MSNAAKHRKKAAEFEQLKQIDRAIAAYIKAVEESEREGADVDVALLNKVGDLALRQGRVADAVTYYERAVEHYATAGLLNNAIALCNKILRSAPGRSNVYFTLGRICARKGLRGDATRNFLEYATRMQQEGRVDEGMRALAEVADLMPELTEVSRLVEEHAVRAGVVLPRRKTPASTPVEAEPAPPRFDNKSKELVFLDLGAGEGFTRRNTPPLAPRVPTPAKPMVASSGRQRTPIRPASGVNKVVSLQTQSLDEFMLFDPNRPTPTEPLRPITPLESLAIAEPATEPLVPVLDVMADSPATNPVVIESPDVVLPGEIEALATLPALPVIEPPELSAPESLVTTPLDAPVELVLDTLVEPIVEPIVETISERGVEEILEPIVETITESPVETITESPVDSIVEPIVGTIVEPTVESIVETIHEPSVAPVSEPNVEPIIAHDVREMEEQQPELEVSNDTELDTQVGQEVDPYIEPQIDVLVTPPEGLESIADIADVSVEAVEGLTSDEFDPSLAVGDSASEGILDGLLPADNAEDMSRISGDAEFVEAIGVGVEGVAPAGLIIEDFEHVADDPSAVVVTGTAAGTPISYDLSESLTPIDVSPIPELDAAIEAGARTAALADADASLEIRRPPFRLDPHDFILPGELPPLLVEDEQVFAGMQSAIDFANGAVASIEAKDEPDESVDAAHAVESPATPVVGTSVDDDEHESDEILDVATPFDALHATDDDLPADVFGSTNLETPVSSPTEDEDLDAEALLRETIEKDRAKRSTPSLHIAAVAAEANAVATSRHEELRAAVLRAPQDWVLRRRLAESLFEVGEREGGLAELQAAVEGFARSGDLASAADIADQLVHIAPEQVAFHQKRVELAVRMGDQHRLRLAYLDLADTLVRMGDDVRAHAVYARVLEIDPWDERARTALGSAAPPPPQVASAPADNYLSLAEWLQEDEPGTTRMRMREPQVSGDEQADFDTLLRHFKEGVSRSLGEEDFESHYDLGVAYKEMGLLDDAISEFQKALRSRRHRLPAYEALGQCFVEQNRHSVAATVLARAVHEPGPSDEHRVGVLYLLAYSCEALQRWDEARSYYSRVYATDIHFRDVAARMAALDLIAR